MNSVFVFFLCIHKMYYTVIFTIQTTVDHILEDSQILTISNVNI